MIADDFRFQLLRELPPGVARDDALGGALADVPDLDLLEPAIYAMAALTIFIAFVICCVLCTDLILLRTSFNWPAMLIRLFWVSCLRSQKYGLRAEFHRLKHN
mgnify:CR=1 FL=1